MSFKWVLFFSSGSHHVYQSKTNLAILAGSQLGISPLKSESIGLKDRKKEGRAQTNMPLQLLRR